MADASISLATRVTDIELGSHFAPIPNLDITPIQSLREAVARAQEDPELASRDLEANMECALDFATEYKKKNPQEVLDVEDIAVIHLYTQDSPIYKAMNARLRDKNRARVVPPFLPLIKLLLSAIYKLPLQPPGKTVYRGVQGNLVSSFEDQATKMWWAFSSATSNIKTLNDETFLGKTGDRTVFSIELRHAYDITAYNAQDEEEVLLPPGSKFVVKGRADMGHGLHMIQLVQQDYRLLFRPPAPAGSGPAQVGGVPPVVSPLPPTPPTPASPLAASANAFPSGTSLLPPLSTAAVPPSEPVVRSARSLPVVLTPPVATAPSPPSPTAHLTPPSPNASPSKPKTAPLRPPPPRVAVQPSMPVQASPQPLKPKSVPSTPQSPTPTSPGVAVLGNVGATKKLVRKWKAHEDMIWAVHVSQDSKYLVTGSRDQTVGVWDFSTGTHLHTLIGHSLSVRAVWMSPDAKYVVSGSADKTVRVWDTATFTTLRVLEGFEGIVFSVCISRDGQFLVCGDGSSAISLWNMASGTLGWKISGKALSGHESAVNSVWVSSDSKHIVSGSHDKTVRVWELRTARCLRTLEGHTREVWCVTMSENDRFIVSGSYDKTVRIWEFGSWQCIHVLQGHSHWVTSVSVSPDCRYVVSAGADGAVIVWDIASGAMVQHLDGVIGWTVYWSPNGKQVAVGDASCHISLLPNSHSHGL